MTYESLVSLVVCSSVITDRPNSTPTILLQEELRVRLRNGLDTCQLTNFFGFSHFEPTIGVDIGAGFFFVLGAPCGRGRGWKFGDPYNG